MMEAAAAKSAWVVRLSDLAVRDLFACRTRSHSTLHQSTYQLSIGRPPRCRTDRLARLPQP